MSPSKLETYLEVLRALKDKGPMKATHISNAVVGINEKKINECLDFLVKQGLIEQLIVEEAYIVFIITQPGKTIIRYFDANMQTLSVIE